jgi:hypothetical protein
VITVLEFIRVAVTEYPKTTDKILTHMDLADEAFDEEIDVLEYMLAASGDPDEQHERIVPRLANQGENEDD